jgi:hypothetical protein
MENKMADKQKKTPKKLVNMVKILTQMQKCPGVPIGFIGSPGMGKSASIEGFCSVNDIPCVVLLASTLNEDDIAGIVVSTAEKQIHVEQNGEKRITPAAGGGAKTLSPT